MSVLWDAIGGAALGYVVGEYAFFGGRAAWKRVIAACLLGAGVAVFALLAMLGVVGGGRWHLPEFIVVGAVAAAFGDLLRRAAESSGVSWSALVSPGVGWLVIGGLAVWSVGGAGGGDDMGVAAMAAPGAAAVPAVQAQAVAEPAAPGCDCAAGAVCTGPRGGKYCLTAEGKKRYLDR